ncbi:MAG: UvrD-helicase domain-containing protein [Rickettsiales bacterium]|jgi:ATP-dependent helicase/nuclease subunit A|nr:UvrD-helicase domain-containing protein [Rickettsiales bacterium]
MIPIVMGKIQKLSENQNTAANPNKNFWVQANAGTGKTSVLVGRLLRILITRDGVNDGILCLTYTNAGAAEMRNRILGILQDIAVLDDNELRDFLKTTPFNTGTEITDKLITKARGIFYDYIDNPDTLKIKTIHSFCEEILRRFPTEAGIPTAWNLVSDADQKRLWLDVFSEMIYDEKNEIVNNAFARIVERTSEYKFDDLLKLLTTQYQYFFNKTDIKNTRDIFVKQLRDFLDMNSPLQTNVSDEKLRIIIAAIGAEKKPAQYLLNIVKSSEQLLNKSEIFNDYIFAYLNKNGTKNINVSKKEYLRDEQDRIYQIYQRKINENLYADTMALFDLSSAFAQKYKQIKQQKNLLDFDDILLYTHGLFVNPEMMGWVLSQLDNNLKHILIDEAQDTSFLQWEIINLLILDFFNTNGAHTIFVVGDTKQSIYGFQGAAPDAFAASREYIRNQIKNNNLDIGKIPLDQSFRSAPAILESVDYFFDRLENFKNDTHRVVRSDIYGRVEIHSVMIAENAEQDRKKYIAEIIEKIESLIQGGVKAGDIMVLVQSRYPFATMLGSGLKRRGINVASEDRINLPEYPAIRDLLNLIRWCIDESDNYALACVLKSPLFGMTENDLYNLLHPDKNANLFANLENTHSDIYKQLSEIMNDSVDLPPYSFFMKLLRTNERREKMITALGVQIVEPLEEFLTICLSYERTQSGTLKHFIKWFIEGDNVIKQEQSADDGVRITTIHSSKGLEAKIVFLIDTLKTPKPNKIINVKKDLWLWSPQESGSSQLANAAESNMETQMAEYNRLLYVAMTRARDELYIYGFTKHTPKTDAWHTRLWNVFSGYEKIKLDGETLVISNE